MTQHLSTLRHDPAAAPVNARQYAVPPVRVPSAADRGNRLLASLPGEDWHHLQPLLEPLSLPMGAVLHDSGQSLTAAYFPTTAIVSQLYVTASGASAEIAVVGNEGIVGIPLFMGGSSSTSRAVVQCAGDAYRVPARVIRDEFAQTGALRGLLLRYTQALIAQIAQMAVCNRHHTLDQQLCRWVLFRLDRSQGSEFAVTHELIAELLGVRREGVTVAAQALQRAGLIGCQRGRIRVLDRLGLEARCCECYAMVKREYDRLLWPGRIGAPRLAGPHA